ncbi:unnamed protein product [Mytilus edulis]|uniref:Uncharacterized protein n=1 Tax=Mytilus edulis TaxID=6550 RepID=A0A8S3QR36_MYTED|nr:unnamed protein product [Mytilus edulis]
MYDVLFIDYVPTTENIYIAIESYHSVGDIKYEETDEQNTSVALYNYMCQNIVGSEEHVKTIRIMNNVRDNLQSDNRCTLITSGSVEGLKLQGSDLDLMKVIKDTKVCEDTNVYFEDNTYFIVETEDTQPGYTQLRLVTQIINRTLMIVKK